MTPAQIVVDAATGHELPPRTTLLGWTPKAARAVLLRLSDGEDHGTSRKAWHRVVRERKTEFLTEFLAGPAPDED